MMSELLLNVVLQALLRSMYAQSATNSTMGLNRRWIVVTSIRRERVSLNSISCQSGYLNKQVKCVFSHNPLPPPGAFLERAALQPGVLEKGPGP